MSWIKNALTEIDGKTFDLKRIAGASLLIGFHASEGYAVFGLHQAFDMQQYGVAAGLMIAAIGAAIGLGAKGESAVTA